MKFLSRDFLCHLGLSKITYRGTWNRSNVWRLGSLCLGFQSRTDGAPIIGSITGANSVGVSRTSHGKEFRIGVHCTLIRS